MKTSETIQEIAPAFVLAQKAIGKVQKKFIVEGKKFSYKYSDLTAVWDACADALHNNDISILQPTRMEEGNVVVQTTLLHKSGEFIQGELTIKSEQQTPQGEGSAFTYARRYSLSALVGICPEDDDGQGAMGKPEMQPPQSKSDNQGNPVCPACGGLDAVIKGKQEYGWGWVCFTKKGGCGAKWNTESTGEKTPPTSKSDSNVGDEKKKNNVTAIRMHADKLWTDMPDNVRHSNVAKLLGLEKLESYNDLTLAQTNRAVALLNKEAEK